MEKREKHQEKTVSIQGFFVIEKFLRALERKFKNVKIREAGFFIKDLELSGNRRELFKNIVEGKEEDKGIKFHSVWSNADFNKEKIRVSIQYPYRVDSFDVIRGGIFEGEYIGNVLSWDEAGYFGIKFQKNNRKSRDRYIDVICFLVSLLEGKDRIIDEKELAEWLAYQELI